MIWIVTIALFVYFIVRINRLEERISKLGRPEIKQPVAGVAEPATQAPVKLAKPAPALSQQKGPDVKRPINDRDWEINLGSKLFTIVGSVAVLLGVGFFLKYAFDHNLITETGRVIGGLVFGAIFLGLGQFLMKKYSLYAQLLTGLGLGIFYLSVYASCNLYHLIDQPLAFIGMIIVTCAGIFLSIQYNSEPLAALAQFGGFLTPILLAHGQNNNPTVLFTYVALLDLGILLLSYYKPWQTLNFTSLFGTSIVYALWFATNYIPNKFVLAISFLTVFFAIFLIANLIQYFRQRIANQQTLLLLTFNTVVYFIFSYAIINPLYPHRTALLAFGLSLVYLVLSLWAFQNKNENDYYADYMLGLAAVLFFIAIPMQFHRFEIGFGWAAEGLCLIALGFRIRSQPIRYLGHAFFIAATLLTLANGYQPQVMPWTNSRFITSCLVSLAAIIGAYIYWIKKSSTDAVQTGGAFAPKNEYQLAITALGLQAYLLLMWSTSLEINAVHELFILSILWAGLAFGIAGIGVETKNLGFRFIGYVTLLIVAFRLFLIDSVVNIRTYTPVLNTRVLTFLFVFGLVASLVHLLKQNTDTLNPSEREAVIPFLFYSNNVLLLWLLSLEVLGFYNHQTALTGQIYANAKNVALSITWILYAAGNLIWGIAGKNQATRIFAILLFGLSIIKVFLYDTVSLTNFARFVSYITLGIILLFSGYLYNRYKDRILQFIKASE